VGGRPAASPAASAASSGTGAAAVASAAAAAAAAASGAGRPAGAEKRREGGKGLNSTDLFAHLPQYRPVTVASASRHREAAHVHPAVLTLGLRYADGSITGGNARCVAMLHALAQVVRDYVTPPGKSLARDLTTVLNAHITFLVDCRPLSLSMGNAIKHLKMQVGKVDPGAPEAEAKAFLGELLASYVAEKVGVADAALAAHAVSKVYDGDVILTYAASHVVLSVLLKAHAAGRRFRVIVLDARPELEGRRTLSALLAAGVPCAYGLISSLAYVMREATKVLLGASGVLSNGTVLSRAGGAAVAMAAAAASVPVLVCCETYKFHERVQLDSITHNELGDPEALAGGVPPGAPGAGALRGWRELAPRLGLLNLKYDAMPAEYVSMVVTEFGMVPPTSVPVILREYRQEA